MCAREPAETARNGARFIRGAGHDDSVPYACAKRTNTN